MPGFFEAIEKFKNKPNKKQFVNIEGKSIQVSLEQKLEIMKVGEKNYFCQKGPNGSIVCKRPYTPKEQQQTQLVQTDNGLKFYENNPFWPTEEGNKAFTWQKK
tara:strand:- start:296 stop:604 length:309 start_codon:yes stop_codon:yes gene_type:complete